MYFYFGHKIDRACFQIDGFPEKLFFPLDR